MNTTDLVARLRGIIAAKPPHVTVLADNEEVYPIRVELLREAADAIDAGHEANVNCNRNVDHLVARLTAAEAEARQRDATLLECSEQRNRLAAAEKVVEAARALVPGAASFLYNSPYRARYNDLREATEAYSSKPITCNCDCGCEVGGTMEADGKCGWCLSGQHKTASENLNISEHKEGK